MPADADSLEVQAAGRVARIRCPDAGLRATLDAVYAPERTRLLRDAQARGARAVSGRWMLVHQAVAQLEAWVGPIDRAQAARVMAEAFGPQPA